jgi:hypothetical protein
MPTYIYDQGQRRVLVDPKAYDSGQRHDIALIYAYVEGRRELVFSREPVALSLSSSQWDEVQVDWVLDSYTPDEFVLFRDGAEIYRGLLKTYLDSGHPLSPSTSYEYTVQSWLGGNLLSEDIQSQTTASYPDLGLVSSATAWDRVNSTWNSKIGSISDFNFKRSSTSIYTGTGTSKLDTGRSASTSYTYNLDARRSGEVIRSDSASATTPARPTSSAIAYGPSVSGGYGWAQSTAKRLSGPNFTFSGGGTNYVSFFNCRINGYSGSTGRFSPHIGGHTYDWQYPAGTSAGDVQWSNVDGGNRALGNGTHGTYLDTGGHGSYRSQWQGYDGGSYSTHAGWGQVNYWWYTSSWVRTPDGNIVNSEDVPGVEGEHLDTHHRTVNDADGVIISRRVMDKHTGEIYEEWGSMDALAEAEATN